MSTNSLGFIFCHCEVDHETRVLINSCVLLGTFHLEVEHYGDPHKASETEWEQIESKIKSKSPQCVIYINNIMRLLSNGVWIHGKKFYPVAMKDTCNCSP